MAKKTISRKSVKVLTKKATKAKAAKEETVEVLFDSRSHELVPTHQVLGQEEIDTFFTDYHVSPQHLPVIFANDAGLAGLDIKPGDIVKITRASPTAGTAIFYRRVAHE